MNVPCRRSTTIVLTTLVIAQAQFIVAAAAVETGRAAKDTLTVEEMDGGDTLRFTLASGREVEFTLLESHSEILLTSLTTLKQGGFEHGTIYCMTCKVRIDGHEMELVRYVPVQETFYEPYNVNGLNIWFDGLRSLSKLFNENHGNCLPAKEARFAFQDATLPVCPEELGNWFALPEKRLLIKNIYSGDDTWLGPYFGADLHGGLDIDMPSNSLLYAPIDFDNQFLFNSVARLANNNRWRGTRRWENGDVWQLQAAHLVELLVPENTPIAKGVPFAYTGGVWAGYTSHTHFMFDTQQPGQETLVMDPWVIFREIFNNNRRKEGAITAHMRPVGPAKTGNAVPFDGSASHHGVWGSSLEYLWDFGDGSLSTQVNPEHKFVEPGIYPVTLTVTDNADSHAVRQHLTVDGSSLADRSITLDSPGNPSFSPRMNWKTSAWGATGQAPSQITFKGYDDQKDEYSPQEVFVNAGQQLLEDNDLSAYDVSTYYRQGKDWLRMDTATTDHGIKLTLQPQIARLINKPGFYEAYVRVQHQAAASLPRLIKVYVDVAFAEPDFRPVITIKNSDKECTKTDYFWLPPQFHKPWAMATSDSYLINRDNSPGESIRFTPNLVAGVYEVELYGIPYQNEMLMKKTGGFFTNITHANGTDRVWVEPAQSRKLGEYIFTKGRDNYVEIISDDSQGLILIDALRFTRKQQKQSP